MIYNKYTEASFPFFFRVVSSYFFFVFFLFNFCSFSFSTMHWFDYTWTAARAFTLSSKVNNSEGPPVSFNPNLLPGFRNIIYIQSLGKKALRGNARIILKQSYKFSKSLHFYATARQIPCKNIIFRFRKVCFIIMFTTTIYTYIQKTKRERK